MDTVLQQGTTAPPSATDGYSAFTSQNPEELAKAVAQPPAMTGGEYGNLVENYKYQQAYAPKPTFSDLMGRAWEQDATIQRVLTQGQQFPHDPDFMITKDLMDHYGKGLPAETQQYLLAAQSEDHMQHIRDQALHELDNEEVLGNAGAKGFGARMLTSLIDPVQAVLGVATGGASAAAFKGKLLAKLVTGGLVNGATNAGIEAYLNNQQLTRDDSNVAIAGALGFGLGALGAHFTPTEATAVRTTGGKLAEALQVDDIAKHGEQFGLTVPEVKPVFKGVTKYADGTIPDAEAEQAMKTLHAPDEPWNLNHSGGAAQTPGSVIEMDHPADFLHVQLPGTDLKIPLRYDLFSIFARQDNPVFRWMNDIIHPNAVGGGLNGVNAMEYGNILHQQAFGNFKAKAWSAWQEYLTTNPVPLWKRSAHHDSFMEQVTAAKRNPDLEVHPAIRKLTGEMHKIEAYLIKEAQRHGVEGAEDVEAAHHYITRKFSMDNRLKLLAKLEDSLGTHVAAKEAVVDTIAKAIRSAQDIAPEKAATVAKAYYKTISELPYKKPQLMNSMMGSKEYAMLRESLREINVPEGDIDAVMEIVTGRPHDPEALAKGTIPRFKKRTFMDENFVNEVSPGVKIKVTDLFENNAGKLMNSYARQLSGASALAKVGIKSSSQFMKYMEQAATWASDHGISDAIHAKHSQFMLDSYKTLMGIPIEDNPGSLVNRSLKILGDFNFFRMMGEAGFAQVAEIGNTMGYVGTRLFMQHLPSYNEIIKTLKGGLLESDQLSKDLHMMLGIGTDMMENPEITKLSDVAFHKGITAAENMANVGKYATSRISGMASINNFLHQISYKVVAAKVVDDALGHSKLTEVQLKKLATAGLSKGDLKSLESLLKKHARFDGDGKLSGIDYEGMTAANPDMMDKFKVAIHREARRAVQQQLRGETHPWMHKLLGQNLMQFRGFTLGAYGKQLLWGMSHMDRNTAMMWTYSTMLGGLTYVAQTSANYAGDQEALDKRLQPKEIAKAAFQRAGFSSVLPSVIDTATDFTSGEPVFRYGRTTGNDTSFVTGSPVHNVATGVTGAVKHVSRAILDDEYMATRSDVSNGLRTVLPNYLVIRNLINSVSDNYPLKNPLRQPED
ncbi:MAG: hypothetical protein KGI54_08305 [Pseudomonadota bacterium]|nr:hypothetical protein [Pseudomonadota bacterium]